MTPDPIPKYADEYLKGPQCGNDHHPKGAWHMATPLPVATIFGWSRDERRFRNNVRKWGCGCDA